MNSAAIAILQQHLCVALAAPPDEARRLFHGRGRQWPGLEQVTVDWLQGVLLVSLFTENKRLLHDIVLGIVFVNRY